MRLDRLFVLIPRPLHRLRAPVRALPILALFLLAPSSILAQAVIQGTVTDNNGAVIVGAQVQVEGT
nr:hypothetical protein [Gemmatimonadota bacterium]